jgi:mono/diheme cytochrome c family protein
MAWWLAAAALLVAQAAGPTAGPGPGAKADTAGPAEHAATVNKYCVTCHSDRLKTGGLTLAGADLVHVSEHADTWEKVIRKLRTGAMPPAGAPRPDQAASSELAAYLETSIDRDAANAPHPGKLALVHRLTRTEYQNAIRDLLAIEALPKEIDYPLLLPADNSSSGFDNIADLLFVSPAIMERYLDAAEKISRLAIGDTKAPVMVNRYRLHPEQWQGARVDDLPWGTRGGLAVKSHFPADGEYVVKVQLSAPPTEPHQLEISVDGERLQLATLGGNAGGRRSGARQPQPRTGEADPDRALEFRIPIKAGPRLVGVTFIERDEVRDESTLRPRMRGRGTEPALSLVTISGPYGAKAPGDSPSRRRIFSCNTDSASCAKQILLSLTRRAYRRPVTDTDIQDLLPFYERGRNDAGFDAGIERALERLLVSPQFLFRVEREPPGVATGTAFKVSDIELASRLSFFLWSSIPDDQLLKVAEQGRLSDPAVLDREVRRMLRDRRSRSLVTNFAEQWLFVRDIEAKQPDG